MFARATDGLINVRLGGLGEELQLYHKVLNILNGIMSYSSDDNIKLRLSPASDTVYIEVDTANSIVDGQNYYDKAVKEQIKTSKTDLESIIPQFSGSLQKQLDSIQTKLAEVTTIGTWAEWVLERTSKFKSAQSELRGAVASVQTTNVKTQDLFKESMFILQTFIQGASAWEKTYFGSTSSILSNIRSG